VAKNDPKRRESVMAWADEQADRLLQELDATSTLRER
jgi:hypothetical protein